MIKKSKSVVKRSFPMNTTLIWLVLGLVLLAQIFIVFQIKDFKSTQSEIEKRLISDLINTAEVERYRTPVADIAENKVYIPELEAYITLSDTSLKLRYDYFDMKDLEALYLSYDGVVGHQTEYHTSANCDKIVSISKIKEDKNSEFKFVGEISPIGPGLKYVHQRDDCKFYTRDLSDRVTKTALILRSY